MQIETKRLILRNYTVDDLEDYWEFVQMEDVGPRCGWLAYTDKQKAKERLYEVEVKNPMQFAIELKDEHKVIGSIEVMETKQERYPNSDLSNSKEIGFLLSKNYWGHGYMPEALKAILNYVFENLGIETLFISHAEKNVNSAKVQDKIGFKVVGRVKDYRTWVDGTMTDSISRSLTKADWKQMNNSKN